MAIKYSVVDAFTDTAFKGNPAVVCWLKDVENKDDKWLQSVATEFNLPTTSYLTPIVNHPSKGENPKFKLRWFTTVSEVELCGHATLAAAHFLYSSGFVNSNEIEFSTLSGNLIAKRIPDNMFGEEEQNERFYIELDFPVVSISDFNEADVSAIAEVLNGASVVDVVKKNALDDIILVLSSAEEVAAFKPEFSKIKEAPGRALIITAPASTGSGFDFCSRVFGPKIGVDEDPVTGSAHCALAVYWHEKLGKCDFVVYQASHRGGVLHVRLDKEKEKQRVRIRGKATTVMEGSLLV